jgi:hypothetical protein
MLFSACEDGTFGVNCSEPCPPDRYGESCYAVCNCPEGEICDRRIGCVKRTTLDHKTDDIEGTTVYKDVYVTSDDSLSTSPVESHSPDRHNYSNTPGFPTGMNE